MNCKETISNSNASHVSAIVKTEQSRYSPENKTGTGTATSFFIQPKLSVGAVNDSAEHEANAIADTIMRMTEPAFVQRKCAHCEEEKAQRKPLTSFIQKKEVNNGIAGNAVSNQIQATKGSGSSMDNTTRSFMESRFGNDFSNITIHTGSHASQLSNQLNAQAFTVGSDIYFGEGKYAPQSSEGKHLLAHELTHTLQQRDNNIQAKHFIQRQVEITCSIDAVKIARVMGGDKSAAAEILNCCEKGLGPLPAGCTGDVVSAARKVLGKKKSESESSGPLKDCPDYRKNRFWNTCCPDQKHEDLQTHNCVPFKDMPVPSLPVPSVDTPVPDVPFLPFDSPSEKGDWNLPDDDTAVV